VLAPGSSLAIDPSFSNSRKGLPTDVKRQDLPRVNHSVYSSPHSFPLIFEGSAGCSFPFSCLED